MDRLGALTPDQSRAAVDTAGESIALTSGAGCGKTLVLARRFTTLLLSSDEGDALGRLVALTFTDKAAAEMLRRVRRVLTEALAASDDPARRERLAEWITELPAARISTIHSFCGSLLRRHAVEAGVDPRFAVCADELVAAQMLTEAVEQAVLAGVEDEQTGVLELLARADLNRVAAD
ncbi:MAG: UvrD-helicase domain-containing protein, partial [Planctomycetota bacterium]